MVDTGSAFTIMSRQSLIVHRFPVLHAKRFKPGFEGVGGHVEATYLENATISVQDRDNAYHHVNVPRLFFTESNIPPIFGRELLTMFSGILRLDFNNQSGELEIG